MKFLLIVLFALASAAYVANGKCGPVDGRCPAGTCCSRWGFCGIFDDHCLLSKGCQPEYGECRGTDDGNSGEKISKDGRCGAGIGRCPAGSCCSKWGSCGIFDDHCLLSNGCQPQYGECRESGSDGHHDDDKKPEPEPDDDDDDEDDKKDEKPDDHKEPEDEHKDDKKEDDHKDPEPDPDDDDDDDDDDEDDDSGDDDDDEW